MASEDSRVSRPPQPGKPKSASPLGSRRRGIAGAADRPHAPHPGRLLGLFAVILAVLYLLVFFTGNRTATPKLGIDLQGGTTVTLQPRTQDGKAPSAEQLKQARSIIESRVNGRGISGAQVVTSGNNIVITVPGQDGDAARSLGQTARLSIRPVLSSMTPQQQAAARKEHAPNKPEQKPNAPRSTPAPSPGAAGPADQRSETELQRDAQAIDAARNARQTTDPAKQQTELKEFKCSSTDPLRGNDDPTKPLITCNREGNTVYLLGPQVVAGSEISSASSGQDQNSGQNVVNLSFKSKGADEWAKFTGAHIGKQAAIVLDTQVISAPQINGAIPAGQNTQVTGNFTQQEARDLANDLKFGGLPLSFDTGQAQTISASLGFASLQAGLIAGLIGLVVVFLYALIYYRALGILTALSLILSGAMVYALLVLLGRWMGYTLDLSGIAGLIIGIGMTADSFVVYFERIKDEIREGRSFRSAVPRGWERAKRTILSGNAVTFIAAAVLYMLAIGEVRGFAFTLGLTTLLDVLVVFLVTHPLVHYASQSHLLSEPRFNGLGAVSEIARERRLAARATHTGGHNG